MENITRKHFEETKKTNKILESIKTFLVAEAQLTKQIHLDIQGIIREVKVMKSILKGVAENGIPVHSEREVL